MGELPQYTLLYIKCYLLCFYSEQAYTLICLHSYRLLFLLLYNVINLDLLTPMLNIFAEYNALTCMNLQTP